MSLQHLAPVLESCREQMNAAFERARVERSNLSPETVLNATRRVFEAVFPTLPSEHPETIRTGILELYRTVVALCAQGQIAVESTSPIEEHVVRSVGSFSRAFWTNPNAFLTSAVQGFANVRAAIAERSHLWSVRLSRARSFVRDVEGFRAAGVVAAWREGMVAFRAPALEVLENDENAATFDLVDADSGDTRQAFVRRVRANRWATSTQSGALCIECGSFFGFGGEWKIPPLLLRDENETIAWDGERAFRVEVDGYGAALIAVPIGQSDQARAGQTPWTFVEPNLAKNGPRTIRLDRPPPLPVTSVVSDRQTLFVTSALSHRVFVYGIPDA